MILFFFCETNSVSMVGIKSILRCFQLVSRLKHYDLVRFSWLLNCTMMEMLFNKIHKLMGMGNQSRGFFWEHVVSRLRKKLGAWKGKHNSFANKVCLIKVVLTTNLYSIFPFLYSRQPWRKRLDIFS